MPQGKLDQDTETADFRSGLPLSLLIHQLAMKIDAQGRALIARHGDLTLPQWRIVRVLGLGAPEGSTALRKVLGFDKSQFSKTVNQLQERGLLSVTDLPTDGRQLRVSLTDAGRAVHERLAPVLEARNDHLMQALAPEERRVIRSALSKLSHAAEATELPKGNVD
ncbi:MarR family winged helix-turn-helix transcriptional regulator [Marinibacterium profundimaris]|uniref:MarR family transcriptional regulator n=1 Tax=Marinibacterium profundimaris TaxID=1679460 RepID=A0A225NTC3_9RHOB|nr:MarR family transcriptional regulator [Marinibacterium profundimaris]OWU74860.1 MarR family transcriptional regulator [Marinibacterium profundimaris]